MSTRTSLLKRLDELIANGEALLKNVQDISSRLGDLAKLERWETSCLHLVGLTFEEDSIYYENLRGAFGLGNREAHLTHGIELLKGAKEEIEKGFLYSIEHLISADFFDSVIEQAEHLLKSGYKDVAAVLGRVVIENTLKDIAKRENISVPEKITIATLNDLLKEKEVYAQNVWRTIQAQTDIGNDAAHGDFDKYNDKSVASMLTWIRETLMTL
jgi:hypothetical protein